MNNKSANIIVLGETGNGKSQFCNYVLRNYFFTVSNNADSETKETKGNYGINGANNIFMIDTPGLQDSRGADKEHLTQLVDYVKTQTHLQAVLIIFNFHQPRFALNIKNMVKLLCIAFPQTDFWNHVGLVFTRFYAKMDEELMDEKIDRAEQFNREINKLIKEAGYYSTSEIICPTFFVDSPKIGKTADFNTEEEVKRLIAWASNLIPLDVSKTQNVDPNIMKEIPEVQKRMVRQNQNKNIQTTIYQQYKRMKQIHYNKEMNDMNKNNNDMFRNNIFGNRPGNMNMMGMLGNNMNNRNTKFQSIPVFNPGLRNNFYMLQYQNNLRNNTNNNLMVQGIMQGNNYRMNYNNGNNNNVNNGSKLIYNYNNNQ